MKEFFTSNNRQKESSGTDQHGQPAADSQSLSMGQQGCDIGQPYGPRLEPELTAANIEDATSVSQSVLDASRDRYLSSLGERDRSRSPSRSRSIGLLITGVMTRSGYQPRH